MVADNSAIIARLNEEEQELEAANAAMSERQATAASRRRSAETAVSESEKKLAELTGQHAEVTALRGQYERTVREATERAARLGGEIEAVRGELAALDGAGSAGAAVADRAAGGGSGGSRHGHGRGRRQCGRRARGDERARRATARASS